MRASQSEDTLVCASGHISFKDLSRRQRRTISTLGAPFISDATIKERRKHWVSCRSVLQPPRIKPRHLSSGAHTRAGILGVSKHHHQPAPRVIHHGVERISGEYPARKSGANAGPTGRHQEEKVIRELRDEEGMASGSIARDAEVRT